MSDIVHSKPQGNARVNQPIKRVIGIDFTDGIIDRLGDRGFTLQEVLPDLHGFRAYFVSLEDPSREFGGFEIQVVTDEVEYLKYQKRKHFFPFIKELSGGVSAAETAMLESGANPPIAHTNTVYQFDSIITSLDGLTRELAVYLGLKKGFDLSCVVLRCRSFDEFCRIAKPDHFFTFNSQPAALIHLGPSCFDLLIVGS